MRTMIRLSRCSYDLTLTGRGCSLRSHVEHVHPIPSQVSPAMQQFGVGERGEREKKNKYIYTNKINSLIKKFLVAAAN